MEKLIQFKELGLSETTLKALDKKGFEEPTPIQRMTIPVLLAGERDIIGQAQTGTGKTAAFGLPLIEKLEPSKNKEVQAIILTPTRELAIQVAEEINSLKGKKKLDVVPVYGGQSIDQQFKKLKSGVDIVVGTPGRIMDHIERKTLKLDNISYFILDEADEMLNMGFVEDIESILKSTPDEKQMLFFSATMPAEIMTIAKKYMKNPEILAIKKDQLTTNLTEQIYFEVSNSDKFEALCRIIDIETVFYGIIFCRTKLSVDEVTLKLNERGYLAEALHGDVSQHQRERILKKFKTKSVNILVATDVAARGIDVTDLTHVINYALPQDPESYVHRIGRTGRAGKEGTAITFVTPEEYRKLLFIKKVAKTEIRKETLPGIEDIINKKKTQIKEDITNIIENETYGKFKDMAKEFLEGKNPEEIVAALMKYSFEDELNERNYNEIKEVKFDVNKKGKSRLFVALGKMDDMTPKKLVDFIKKESGVEQDKLKDVKIFDKFSFITVPFEEAEIIVEVFKRGNKGKRPLVEKAKESKK